MKSARKSKPPASNIISPTGKKLVQARLPFKTVVTATPPKTQPAPSTSSASKTQSSPASSSSTSTAKTPQTATSPTNNSTAAAITIDIIDSDTQDDATVTTANNELPRKRKLSATSPATPNGSSSRKAKVNRTDKVNDSDILISLSDDDAAELSDNGHTDLPESATPKITPKGKRKKTTPAKSSAKKKADNSKVDRRRSTPRAAVSNVRKRKAVSPPVTGNDDCLVIEDSEDSTLNTDVSNNATSDLVAALSVPMFAIKLPLLKKRAVESSIVATTPASSAPASPATRTSPRKFKEIKTPIRNVPVKTGKTPAKSPIQTPIKTPSKTAEKTPATAKKANNETPVKSLPAETPTKTSNRSSRSNPQPSVDKIEVAANVSVLSLNGDKNDVEEDEDIDQLELSGKFDSDAEENPGTPGQQRSSTRVSKTVAGGPIAKLTPKQLAIRQRAEARQLEKDRERQERERRLADEKDQRQRERDEKDRQRRREREEKEEQKRTEKEKKRLEELDEKRRKEEQREEERRKNQEQKEEERRKKEEQKEEERRKKDEQKEEERRKKDEQKEEERRKKDEQKEEERRKKDEEKLAKEEAEKKKMEKSAAVFSRFFVPRRDPTKTPSDILPGTASETSNDGLTVGVDDSAGAITTRPNQNFMPFCVKDDMKLAPLVRRLFSELHREAFDECVLRQTQTSDAPEKLYLVELREKSVPRGRDGKTWSCSDTDVHIVDDELEGAADVIEEPTAKQTYRAKFFKFTENRRPPYYGTWRRRSTAITPRKPFVTDKAHFDYECDSDDEWEEEEPGESLHGSDDEKDRESDDDEYDIDNQFFVPHGHLSDEEIGGAGDADDDDEDEDDDDLDEGGSKTRGIGIEIDDNSPAVQKAKLKIIQQQFANEMKKKTEKIKPRLVGCVWRQRNGAPPESCPSVIWEMLCARAMVFDGTSVRLQRPEPVPVPDTPSETTGETVRIRARLTDDDVADLIRLVHGNTINRSFMQSEFLAHLERKHATTSTQTGAPVKPHLISKAALLQKIQELARYRACPDEGEMIGKFCWYVDAESRAKYGCAETPIPNVWQYTLKRPKHRRFTEGEEAGAVDNQLLANGTAAGPGRHTSVDLSDDPSKKTKKASKFNISQFTRVLTDDDKRRRFAAVSSTELGQENTNGVIAAAQPTGASSDAPTTATAPAKRKRVKLQSVPLNQSPGQSAALTVAGKSKADAATPTPVAPVVRKRVSLLASVPLNQEIPAATKNALISNFLNQSKSAAAAAVGIVVNVETAEATTPLPLPSVNETTVIELD